MASEQWKERPPAELPIHPAADRRNLDRWRKRMWRASGSDFDRLLNLFWHEAYSAGLKDMNRMHSMLDRSPEVENLRGDDPGSSL